MVVVSDDNTHAFLIFAVEKMKSGCKLVSVQPEIETPSNDEGSVDFWVKRNTTLIRLTGKHPLNCEPPLSGLIGHGFITPSPLHFVRNHGAVPRADWDTWTVVVCGLVEQPLKLTMHDIVFNFPSIQMPVTLVCAGNRRKEQNMVRQTVGFNWGPGAVSTSLWRGAPLCAVLSRCGILSGARHVCFEGAEDLPGGGGSKYGTSIKREVAEDPSRDIMIAYMQNGEVLAPDHGFPVRIIIPGFIGGRMVKWLKRIIVTNHESDSYYHYHDNRVLPSHVDAQLADAQGWWYNPEYIINELNINSVITQPGHGDILPINSILYTMRGYAYSGGGKMVTRVEVTLDRGSTWLVCTVHHHEKPSKYGRHWCWCFWSLSIEPVQLMAANEMAVRAWDETHNTQPENLIWNLMGMMNNCLFRVKISVHRNLQGEACLAFAHPTQPGNQSGGWMKHADQPAPVTSTISVPKRYPMWEVRKHCGQESAWIVVQRNVYDCTGFIKDHPGGKDSILLNAGTDCTEEFESIHSRTAKSILGTYQIGDLETAAGFKVTKMLLLWKRNNHGRGLTFFWFAALPLFLMLIMLYTMKCFAIAYV